MTAYEGVGEGGGIKNGHTRNGHGQLSTFYLFISTFHVN